MRIARLFSTSLTVLLLGISAAAAGSLLDGYFGVTESTPRSIDLKDLHEGCPRADCIPAIDVPRYLAAPDVDFIADDDLVLGVVVGDEARAYPLVIMDQHEIVNDEINGQPVAITWCPLCGSALAFDPRVDGERLVFGVSGVLHNSDLVMFDRKTRSLWTQIEGVAIVGELTGAELKSLPSTITTWGQWRAAHPDTLCLSTETGHAMRYAGSIYGDYQRSETLMFPVKNTDFQLPAKTVVFGLSFRGDAVAITKEHLDEGGPREIELGGVPMRVSMGDDGRVSAVSRDDANIEIPATRLFYFAWVNFHPRSRIISE